MHNAFSFSLSVRLAKALVSGVMLFILIPEAYAQSVITAYDSFGPGGTYNYERGIELTGEWRRMGIPFTPTASGQLQSVDLALTAASQPSFAEVGIYQRNSVTGFPSTPLEIFSASGLIRERTETGEPVRALSFRSSTEPMLEQSTSYWLVVTALSTPLETQITWYSTLGNNIGEYYYLSDVRGEGIGPVQPPSVLRITVAQVPEPQSAGLVLAGLAVIAFGRMIKRKSRFY
jgi:hypothetical protein